MDDRNTKGIGRHIQESEIDKNVGCVKQNHKEYRSDYIKIEMNQRSTARIFGSTCRGQQRCDTGTNVLTMMIGSAVE